MISTLILNNVNFPSKKLYATNIIITLVLLPHNNNNAGNTYEIFKQSQATTDKKHFLMRSSYSFLFIP